MVSVEFNNILIEVVKKTREAWMEKEWHPGIITDFDDGMGKGVLFLLELEKGLTVAMSDSVAKDDVAFVNKAYTANNIKQFCLNFLSFGDVYIVDGLDEVANKKYYMLNKSVMHHGKSNFSFIAPKGEKSRVIDIIMTYDWVVNQFPYEQQAKVKESISKIENLRSFYIDPIPPQSVEFVREILDKVFYKEWNYVFIQARVKFLIELFISNYILEEKIVRKNEATNGANLSMLKVKEKIDAAIFEKLPNKKELAKEFFISESTLDRQFKKHFGKSVSKYHLDEKLELAKRIILRNENSISQIAYLLGYETASSFNKSFRNYFGLPPGAFRK